MENEKKVKDYLLPASILLSTIIIAGAWFFKVPDGSQKAEAIEQKELLALEAKVIPSDGIELPVNWDDLGLQLINSGVIEKEKFMAIYADRGDLSESDKNLLEKSDNGKIIMTQRNANFLLNLFWALGLGNKNEILENGPMTDKKYGEAGGFASTGGWSLAKGNVMDHYSKHSFVRLTTGQQALVERVSQNIYRPCCGNSTYFPDCNHGMAMLGLLELMASRGVSEQDMYRIALRVNAYWFPDTYLTIAKYLELKGSSWDKAEPKDLLGADYSSSAGYQKILNEVSPPTQRGGGSCGV